MMINGVEFVLRRGTWVGVPGSETVIHLRENDLGWQGWYATHPAVEPVCFSNNLEKCAIAMVNHYNAERQAARDRFRKVLLGMEQP
jgi:hypothetical protein